MKLTIEDTKELLMNRRTYNVQKLTDKDVSEEIISNLIEVAHWAPNHGLIEPWHFLVIKGDERKKLAEFQASLYKKNTLVEEFKESKYQKLLRTPRKVSTLLAIIMKHDPEGRIPEIENIEAVACAVQNMHLLASAYKLGAKWSSGKLVYSKEMNSYFKLNKDEKLLGFFYIGYPEKNDLPKAHRNTDFREKMTYWKSD